jgi:type IV pilus assembly protein PilY1
VWRVDVAPNRTANETGVRVVVGKFAELSDTGPAFVPDPLAVQDHRKIFYPPEIVPVLNDQFSTLSRYDLVVVLTGRRDNPLNQDVLDRAYSLRDFHVDPMTDVDNSGFGDGFPDGTTYTTIIGPTASNSSDDLFDATFVIDDPIGAQLDDLQTSEGWYIDLTDPGEKALAAPVVLGGKLFFTTYLPAGVAPQSSCTLTEGLARLFAVDVLTGGVVFNYDDADGTETHTVSDKSKFAGNGISSDFSVYFGPDGALLQYETQGTPKQENPDLDDLFGRTYWYEQ